MQIFDSHAHYDDERFDEDRDALLAVLPARGVGRVVDVGADIPSSRAAVRLAGRYDHLWAAVGVHPHEAKAYDAAAEAELRRLLAQPRVVALGEIGLDFFYDRSERDVQERVFRRQLELASELDRPVIIHSRDAAQLTRSILREYPARGVIHCFTYSAELAAEWVADGWYIGFTGVVTFKNAKKPAAAAEAVPLDRLLIETDCPYLAPEPYRGTRCDSTMLSSTAARLADIKGVAVGTLLDAAWRNACAVYRLPV